MKIDLKKLSEKFKDVEFFLICIFPEKPLSFSESDASSFHVLSKENFWSISSKTRDGSKSLLHEIGAEHILFRGYETDMSVHSYTAYSEMSKLVESDRLVNGVFSYIRINDLEKKAIVKGDALGVSPLFYREDDGCFLFSSHASLIHKKNDKINLVSWMSLMQNGFNFADNCFYEEINRFPAGSQLTLAHNKQEMFQWFDLASLPDGDALIDEHAFQEVEDAYKNSMQKCLTLKTEAITLPFSSGYDSRRFFAFLQGKKVPFKAITCQSFHRKNGKDYDIDAHFAPKIAAAFGVNCEVLAAADNSTLQQDNQRRMALIGTETFMHEWSFPLMKWLAEQPPSIVFDGLAGDTLGNSGFEFEGLHESPEKDLQILMEETIKPEFFDNLSSAFPSLDAYKQAYRKNLLSYPATLNRAEFIFLQSRTRRCISPWITMMHPPGQVVVFPYYDMGFVRATMKYSPAEKYKWFFQKECLKRFYPDYFEFNGSRNLPNDLQARPVQESQAIDRIRSQFLYEDIANIFTTLKYLNLKNKLLLLSSLVFKNLRSRRNWIIRPLLLLVKTDKNNIPFLE
jgi:hypothetical protein